MVYLLLYFHLVVQVMSVGLSLGRGGLIAEFLVVKKRGAGNKGGRYLLKHTLAESALQPWELESKSNSASGDQWVFLSQAASLPKWANRPCSEGQHQFMLRDHTVCKEMVSNSCPCPCCEQRQQVLGS